MGMRLGGLLSAAAVFTLMSCSAPHTDSTGFLGLDREPHPGYAWRYPDSYFSNAVEWRPGTRHPAYPHAQAAAAEGEWTPDPGYQFARTGDLASARWLPGSTHALYPHTHAAAVEGEWTADPGYNFTRPGDFTSASWTPGSRHSGYPHARADSVPGQWLADPGYLFLRRGDLASASWSPGARHPDFPNIYAGAAEETWLADSGYQWASATPGDLRVVPAFQPASQTYGSPPPPGNDLARRVVHVVARNCARPQEGDGFWGTLGRLACTITAVGTSSPGD